MRSIAKSVLMLMLAAVAASAVAATTAQAQEGPYWDVTEERLEEGHTEELKETAKTSLKVEDKLGQTVTCTGAKLASGGLLVGSSGANAGTSKETAEYTGCSVTGNGAECKVEGEKFTTNALKATLGYSTEKRESPALVLIQPATGTTVAELKFSGKCTVSTAKITGTLVGELPKSETETTEKELKLTKAEKTIWTEAGGKLTSTKAKLEIFGLAATAETVDELDTKQIVGVLMTWPTSVCKKPLTEFITRCNVGGYFEANEDFKLKNIGEIVIVDVGGNTIKCTESSSEFTIGENPNATKGIVATISGLTFGGCKTGTGIACTLKTPEAGFTAFPWEGLISWIKGSTTGYNGGLSIRTVSINAICEGVSCRFVGAGIKTSIPGAIFNADDTNKPAMSERAVFQLKNAILNLGGACSGIAELTGTYSITPTAPGTDVYVSST